MLQQLDQLNCSIQIDYSEVKADRVLPFLIELDLFDSEINPGTGVYQRFCYNISGIGFDMPLYADLDYIILDICDEITEEQIKNISVVVDGDEQIIEYGEGGNVVLLRPDNPDPITGKSGLKFDFALDKVDGEMSICYELTKIYPLGLNEIILCGEGIAAGNLSLCGPVCSLLKSTKETGLQPSTVYVPVTITPYANAGTTATYCSGSPTVKTAEIKGENTVSGNVFTITQNFSVSVPVEFGATASVGDFYVQSGDSTAEKVTIVRNGAKESMIADTDAAVVQTVSSEPAAAPEPITESEPAAASEHITESEPAASSEPEAEEIMTADTNNIEITDADGIEPKTAEISGATVSESVSLIGTLTEI